MKTYIDFLNEINTHHTINAVEIVKSLKNGIITEDEFIQLQVKLMNTNTTYLSIQYPKDWNMSDFNMKTSYKKYTDEEKIDWIERNTSRGSWTFCDDDDKISEFNYIHKIK